MSKATQQAFSKKNPTCLFMQTYFKNVSKGLRLLIRLIKCTAGINITNVFVILIPVNIFLKYRIYKILVLILKNVALSHTVKCLLDQYWLQTACYVIRHAWRWPILGWCKESSKVSAFFKLLLLVWMHVPIQIPTNPFTTRVPWTIKIIFITVLTYECT